MPERGQVSGGGRKVRRPLRVVEVTGPSMVPTLYHGDLLLVRYGTVVRPGDVVILRHPFQQDLLVVKRAVERRPGGWWVRGDNTFAGGDSTDYGVVPEELVLARVLARYRPLPKVTKGGASTKAGQGVTGPGTQRSVTEVLGWAASALRPVRSASARLRAR
ncbi:nickel-type superoxide dismutase maturation protease [Streptomyces sp. cmx-18-6]|uniref:nickel-type superoxide dismutase maturation protease n=1 Tax=Streptomyces sp. cmx-18-6 TaxID=2790930 RepID=UPI0039815441